MLALAFYVLAVFGFCFAVGHAGVSQGVRESMAYWQRPLTDWLLALVQCPACLGFWVGLGTGAVHPALVPFELVWPLAALALGFFTCGANYVLGVATGWISEAGD